jgi:ketosteroid isomerase-like protein
MNPFRKLICCAALLGFAYGCAEAQVTSEIRAEAEQAVRELENGVSKAFTAKSLDALISLYAENAALYNDQGPMIRRTNAIREAWSADFTRHGLTMGTEPRTIEISNSGTLAWAHGIFKISVDSPDKRASDEWEYALIYTKQPDGKWKITADSAHALLQHRLYPAAPQRGWRYAIRALFWWATYIGSLLFLLVLPVVTIVSIWNSCRTRKVTTGLLISVAMSLLSLVRQCFSGNNLAHTTGTFP